MKNKYKSFSDEHVSLNTPVTLYIAKLKQKFIKCLDNSEKVNYWSKMPPNPI